MATDPVGPPPVRERFDIRRRLGAGGMGVVYEAWDRTRNLRVALKTLAEVLPEPLLALKREFRSVATVSHPNLVTFYELLSDGEQWLLSMEYVEGTDFARYVRAHDACDVERLRHTLPQIIRAVQALHAAGLLHRDLKPSNVQVTPEGHAVVLDFGLTAPLHARRFEGESGGDLSGTVAYMSPEHTADLPLTEASDWYALGVMVYEAFAGRLPFEGGAWKIFSDRQSRDATPLLDVVPDAPADLALMCDGLLRRDAAARLDGAGALRLLGEAVTDDEVSASPLLFVGRDAELATLRRAYRAERRPAGWLIAVHGQSGVGKSALVARFLEDVASDAVVFAGRCYEQESVPYKAFDGVLDAMSRHLASLDPEPLRELLPPGVGALARVFPVLDRVYLIADAPRPADTDPLETRRRAFGALRTLLSRLAERRPIVIHVDDLQWADLDSVQLLHELFRPPDPPPFLMIGAWREGFQGRSAFLDALNGERFRALALEVHDIPLGPLSAAESRALASAVLGGAGRTPGRLSDLLRESGGNPYFLRELASGATTELGSDGGTTLDALLSRRVAALPDDARAVLEVIALAARPLHERDACHAAGLTTPDAKTLALLRARNLIRGSAGEIESYHDRVRETVVANMDANRRRTHHQRLAVVLSASSAATDAEAVAGHLEAAGALDEAGRHYALAAERAAATLAFQRAADLFGKALSLSTATGAERRRLQTRLADALADAGLGADAARAYREAGANATGQEALALAHKEAYWSVVSGYAVEARDAVERFLAGAGLRVPSRITLMPRLAIGELRLVLRGLRFRPRRASEVPARLLQRADFAWDAVRCFMMFDTPASIYFMTLAVLLALKTGDRTRIARAVGAKLMSAQGFRSPLAARLLPRFRATFAELCAGEESPYVLGIDAWVNGFLAFFEGRYQDCHDLMLRADALFAESTGVAWERAVSVVYAVNAEAHLGRVSAVLARVLPLVDGYRASGDRFSEHSMGAHASPFAEMGAGRPERALAIMDASRSHWGEHYVLQCAALAFVRAWTLLYQGRAAEAWRFVNAEWPALRQNHYLQIHQIWQWIVFVRAEAALAVIDAGDGAPSALRRAEKDARALSRDRVCRCSPGLAALVRAGVAAARGSKEAARAHLAEATTVFDATGMIALGGAAKRRLAQLSGGERGGALLAEADRAMLAAGIAEPERMTQAFANGFSRV
ncbi:MAG: protein kinase [Gemmatimonadota bacterium]|nr:protein kinase [Gemmatimonadota bacterium]